MVSKNVILNYTLEKYNKKYRNRRHRLLKYSKKQVEDFDKQYCNYIYDKKTYSLEHNYFLLREKKWALIGDTYYEIPRPIRLTWFRNLNAGVQAVTCLFGAGVIVVPTLMFTLLNNGPKEWYEDKSFINRLKESDVGLEKEILVNGQVHKVRLIGIDHDDLAEGNGKAHTTWEFANLISDDQGYSLAYQWNDTNDKSTANFDYINSTIRYALTGEGTNGGKNNNTILVAQKGQTTWSSDYNKTILSMLPTQFSNAIKKVKKSVGTTNAYDETTYTDKLFMLSVKEMGYKNNLDQGYGDVYSYYKSATSDTDVRRIKQQVNNSEASKKCSQISSGSSGQAYQDSVSNYGGYNNENDKYGGWYWLRSPTDNWSGYTWCCRYDGYTSFTAQGGTMTAYSHAFTVAPVFCL